MIETIQNFFATLDKSMVIANVTVAATAAWGIYSRLSSVKAKSDNIVKDRQISALQTQVDNMEDTVKVQIMESKKSNDMMLKIAMASNLKVNDKIAIASDWAAEDASEDVVEAKSNLTTEVMQVVREEATSYIDSLLNKEVV